MKRIHANPEILSAFLDGQLDPRTTGRLECHLTDCASCRETLSQMRQARVLMRELRETPAAPGLESSILERIGPVTGPLPARRYVPYAVGSAAIALLFLVFLANNLSRRPTPLAQAPREIPGKSAYVPKPSVPEEKRPAQVPSVAQPLKGDGQSAEKQGRDNRLALLPSETRPAVKDSISVTDAFHDGGDKERPAAKRADESVVGNLASEESTLMESPGRPAGVPAAPAEEREGAAGRVFSARETAASRSTAAERREGFSKSASASPPAPVLPGAIVVRSEKDWTRVWAVQNRSQNLSDPLPAVDFRNQMVVAVPSRARDAEVRIVNVEEREDAVVVQYRETPPSPENRQLPAYQIQVVNTRPAVKFEKVNGGQ